MAQSLRPPLKALQHEEGAGPLPHFVEGALGALGSTTSSIDNLPGTQHRCFSYGFRCFHIDLEMTGLLSFLAHTASLLVCELIFFPITWCGTCCSVFSKMGR